MNIEDQLLLWNDKLSQKLSQDNIDIVVNNLEKTRATDNGNKTDDGNQIEVFKKWVRDHGTLKDVLLVSFLLNQGIYFQNQDNIDEFEQELLKL
jgi:hypothetical protein